MKTKHLQTIKDVKHNCTDSKYNLAMETLETFFLDGDRNLSSVLHSYLKKPISNQVAALYFCL